MLPSQIKRDRVYDREFFPPTSTDATPYQDVTKRKNDLLNIPKKEIQTVFEYLGETDDPAIVLKSFGFKIRGPKNQEYIIVDRHVLLEKLQQKYVKANEFEYFAKLKNAAEYEKLNISWIKDMGICRRKYDSMAPEDQKRFINQYTKNLTIKHGYETKLKIALKNQAYVLKKKISMKKIDQIVSEESKKWNVCEGFTIDCDQLAKEICKNL